MAPHVSEHDVYERESNRGSALEFARNKFSRERISRGERLMTDIAVALLLFLGGLIFYFHSSEPIQNAASTVRMEFAQLDSLPEALSASPPAVPPFNR